MSNSDVVPTVRISPLKPKLKIGDQSPIKPLPKMVRQYSEKIMIKKNLFNFSPQRVKYEDIF